MLSKIKVLLLFYILMCLFICCKNEISNTDNYLKILSPESNWIYTDEIEIPFLCNVSEEELIWISSLQGEIGRGNGFNKVLCSGNHTISVTDKNNNVAYVNINVIKRENDHINLITRIPYIKKFKNEISQLGIISLNGIIENLDISSLKNINDLNEVDCLKKDISVSNDVLKMKTIKQKNSRNLINQSYRKKFFVMNTSGISYEAHEVIGKKYYEGEKISVWLTENYDYEIEMINEIIQKLEYFVLKRVEQLWGNCVDINQDGSFTLLFCPSINQEKNAIGFFNSADFFTYNNQKEADDYNPYSNEMDIIYVAIPEKGSINYSIDSILATIAHEYTHAINFTNKTWKKIIQREENIEKEAIFLDEGWSHLTESLVGYGESGGNSDFMNYYLENMNYYSFCCNDYLGRNDSVGQRGAICLFLYWCFNKAGGINYSENGIDLIDNGGISFLRDMINSDEFGWESIGSFFQKSTDILFLEFAEELLNSESTSFITEKIDPITKERVFVFNGIKNMNQNQNRILPYSINLITLEKNNMLYINGKNLKGNVYLFVK